MGFVTHRLLLGVLASSFAPFEQIVGHTPLICSSPRGAFVLKLKGGTGETSLGRPSETGVREASFKAPFPFDSLFPLTPSKLAAAGFRYAPSSGKPDRCECTACNLALHSWARTDDPFFEHLRWNKSCPHAAGLDAELETALPVSILPNLARLLRASSRWGHAISVDVPTQFATLNLALRSCPFRHRLVARLSPDEHSLPTELRVASFHELLVVPSLADEPTAGSPDALVRRRPTVKGTWWLMPGSCGQLLEVNCHFAAPARRQGHVPDDSGARATVTVWGGPWTLEQCDVRCGGGLGLLCSQRGEMLMRGCAVGGTGAMESAKAASGVYVMQAASLVAAGSTVEHCRLYGVRGSHAATVAVDGGSIRWTDRAVGIGDDAVVSLRACEILASAQSVFQASSPAAGAKLRLTGCVLEHRGPLWLDRHRPGEVTERQHVGADPTVSVFTTSISGPKFQPRPPQSRQQAQAAAAEAFIPGLDRVQVTQAEWSWATTGSAPPR